MTEPDDRPAIEIVQRFGDDIKAAINEIVNQTPNIAKDAATTTAKDVAGRRAAWVFVGTWASAVLVAAGVAWLMLTYYPRAPRAVDITFRHDGLIQRCVRLVDSPPDHPVFVCHTTR